MNPCITRRIYHRSGDIPYLYIYIYNWEYNPFTKWAAHPSNNEIEWDLVGFKGYVLGYVTRTVWCVVP